MNAEIAGVVAEHPVAMVGPDLWALAKTGPGTLAADGILSTDGGAVACCAANDAPVIARMPCLVGEFGESTGATVCGLDGSVPLMGWLDDHETGYVTRSWKPWGTNCAGLSLITNVDGTPKAPNGTNRQQPLERVLGIPRIAPAANGSVGSRTGQRPGWQGREYARDLERIDRTMAAGCRREEEP